MSNNRNYDKYEFYRNMRRTPWQKLFPHWWSENDLLLNAIGDEVERIKALSIFSVLNAGIKPPVMTWKESIVHKEYHVTTNLTQLSSFITIQAPLYKTWGNITLTNNTKEDIDTLQIMINQTDGLLINQVIKQGDKIVFNLETQKVTINDTPFYANNINDGIPYFKTVQNKATYDENTPLHNEVVRIQFTSKNNIECDIDVDVQFDNVVFTDEQNIEVTGLELVPIDHIDVYANYDFPYNEGYNGWHKVYQKKYDKNTNVLYDMISLQLYTKEWYVEVFFKGLQYPYKVAFPCYRDAPTDSMYHVNNRLDTWGEQLGLERRNYKTNIPESDYPTTYPAFYPYDIEQDYWYYKRLTNEYSWNHLAINDATLTDTEGHNLIRLHSINPFVEDFVVHAKSTYPTDKTLQDYNQYTPVIVSEQSSKRDNQQVHYSGIKNLLTYDDSETIITLYDKNGTNINDLKYQSKELWTYFDVSDLPEDVNIDNIEIIVEGSSTDNKIDKHSNNDTGLIIPNLYEDNITFIPLYADKSYQLNNQSITYSSNDLSTYLKELQDYSDEVIVHKSIIGVFEGQIGKSVEIPFKCYENDEFIDDITDVWVYFNGVMVDATYKNEYITVTIPNTKMSTHMTFIVKSRTHKPLTATIDIGRVSKNKYALKDDGTSYVYVDVKDENGDPVKDSDGNTKQEKKIESIEHWISGPSVDGRVTKIAIEDEWHTKDVRNIIQKQGIYFRNIFENDNEQSQTTINIKNIILKVSYSNKKSTFRMTTYIDHDVERPKLGQYSVTVENTGQTSLHTDIDVITAPNIKMSENHFDVKLQVNEKRTYYADIYQEPEIDDGHYDILTVCEKFTKRDTISVYSVGMVETGIRLDPQHAKYTEECTVSAEIVTADGERIQGGNVEFYVNNYLVRQPVTIDENNIATITFKPQDYNFINTGLQNIEVKYSGNEKYASSKAKSEIFIRKESITITIDANENATYLNTYDITAYVSCKDENGNKIPVTDGTVTFYANNILLGQTDLLGYTSGQEGIFALTLDSLFLEPGKYTLWARYGDSDIYASDEQYKTIRVFGGETTIHVFDIDATPMDTINIRAKISDSLLEPVETGTATLNVYYNVNNERQYIIQDVTKNVVNGLFEHEYDLTDTNFGNIQNDTINATIELTFGGSGFINSVGYGELRISKRDVTINTFDTYYGTQHEPLGFLVQVIDTNTQRPVKDGTIHLDVPKQNNIIGESNVDENGYARIIYNPMVHIEAWDTTGKFQFVRGTDEGWLYKDGIVIDLKEEYPELFTEENYQEPFLYAVTDDNLNPKDFFEIKDGVLEYINTDEEEHLKENTDEVENYFFIDPNNGELYRQTSSTVRLYETGRYNIRFTYSNSSEYKTKAKTCEKGLFIDNQNANLDLHTYLLDYDKTHDIICYVDAEENEDVGDIVFYIDEERFLASHIEENKAIIPFSKLTEIKHGDHLIKAVYMFNDVAQDYTYSLLELNKVTPTIVGTLHAPIKNEESTLEVTVSTKSNKSISGFVNIYLDGELIDYQYLYGNEGYYGVITESYTAEDIKNKDIVANQAQLTFKILMPDDIDTNFEHYIDIEYEGNDLIERQIIRTDPIIQTPLDTMLNIEETHIARGQKGVIDVEVLTTEDYHIINEGFIQILNGEPTEDNRNVVAQAPVHNNKAILTWTPDMDNRAYYIQYSGTYSYKPSPVLAISEANIILEDAQDYIKVSAEIDNDNENTPIYDSLQDAIQCISNNGVIEIIDDNYTIQTPLTIDKSVIITGEYNPTININADLIMNGNIQIDNVTLQSENNSTITNRNQLRIIYSIIKDSISINSNSNLTINRSLVYGKINANNADLDNNWWGQNQPPYNVNNHIILSLTANESPSVIYDNVNIVAKMIGANNKEYDIPETDFKLTADSGYFSIDNGKMINHTVNTTYFDATEEGNIYLTVDNETIQYPIYDYHRKTELILEPITDVPVGYYVTFNANVCSITDSYDSLSDINGYVDFYFDDQHIGRCDVVNNKAQTTTYIKSGIQDYSIGTHTIKAKYTPTEYYFTSSQEQSINIIETNNIYYVSPSQGSDMSNGTFTAPFKTIQKAIDESQSGYTIFLKEDKYDETNINIDKNVTIQSYGNNVTFEGLEGDYIFNITATSSVNEYVSINKINFVNNQVSNLINTSGLTFMEQCLIYDNQGIADGGGDVTIEYSAIINQDIDEMPSYNKCWFGTNEKINNATNQVIMQASASKDVLYKGIVALIKGSIDTYIDTKGNKVELEKTIPLRIAEFFSDIASLRPLKDYTYNNYALSLLDTNADSNSGKYKITLLQDTYYIEQDVPIRYSIKDAITDENINAGAVDISLQNENSTVTEVAIINDGIATVTFPPLKAKQYNIICTYDDSSSITTMQNTIIVKKHDIIVESFQQGDYNNHVFNINEMKFSATDNEAINNEKIDIYIDDDYITTSTIEKNYITLQRLEYPTLTSGYHIISFVNKSNSKYDAFKYETKITVDKIDSKIIFDYDKIQKNTENDFTIQIMEDNELYSVISGDITVVFDDEIIVEDKALQDGICILPLTVKEKGQYSVYIHYHDDNDRYNDSTETFIVNVDIFKINIEGLPDIINVDMGKTILFKHNVVDASRHPVSKGYFNIYIDDILIKEKVSLTIGQLIQEIKAPTRIGAGEHTLKLEYIDETDNYLDTNTYRTLKVNKIKTSINIGNGMLYPNQEGYIPFNITSNYGTVNTGTFSIKLENEYGDTKTYITPVSDNLIHQINLTVPNLPAGEYPIEAQYIDDSGNYENATLNTTINISKNQVIIEPNYTTYYPQTEFTFTADIFNQSNKRIDSGYVDIYVDNIKEKENIEVQNGQISTKMIFNVSKVYKIDIIYYDDTYYDTTSYNYDFIVGKVNLQDINIITDENNEKITEIQFDTFNDIDVTDGVLYLYIDDIQMEGYNITSIHKYIDLDISYLTKGNHTIGLSYISSFTFNDFRTQKTITINPKESELNITTNNITQDANNTITVKGNINVDTSGMLKFYIKSTTDENADYKFIGLCNFENNDFTFEYRLSPNIIAGEYQIKAEFLGDAYYDGTSDDNCILTVNQETVEITVTTNAEAYYQEEIPITITTAIPDALINLYVENDDTKILIDTIVVNDRETIDYRLQDDLIGKCIITAEYGGSPTYKPVTSTCELIINPYTPIINNDEITANIGGILVLPNEVYNNNHETIHIGQIKYTIGEKILECDAGVKYEYQMSKDTNIASIQAQYISEDTNKTLNSEVIEIPIELTKNDVYINIIKAPQYINYNEPFDIVVKLSSLSLIEIDVEMTSTYQYDIIKDEEDSSTMTAQCIINTQSNNDEYTINIDTISNEYFNSAHTEHIVKLNHMNYITVNTEEEISSTNTNTLSDAIDIVKNNGIIDIMTPIVEENIIIDKDITINGNDNNINSSTITNKGNIILNDVNCIETQIINNGHIEVNDSTFTDNIKAILTNDNYMEVNNCEFSNNNTGEESCVEIISPNIHTVINDCTFTANNGTGNATCIMSKRANELEISNTKFIENTNTNTLSSCIYAYGNSAFYKNIFYNNDVHTDIRVIKGEIIADKNIFSSINNSIRFESDSHGDIDLNYWGDEIKIIGDVEINNWLIGELIKTGTTITPHITQYVNTLETETTDINIEYDDFEVSE